MLVTVVGADRVNAKDVHVPQGGKGGHAAGAVVAGEVLCFPVNHRHLPTPAGIPQAVSTGDVSGSTLPTTHNVSGAIPACCQPCGE